MISPARTPVARDLRLICGHSAQSLVPLPATGATVTFTNANFAVAPGGRYGIEFRIVRTADGVHSRALFLDLRRKEFTTTEHPENTETTELGIEQNPKKVQAEPAKRTSALRSGECMARDKLRFSPQRHEGTKKTGFLVKRVSCNKGMKGSFVSSCLCGA